MPVSLCLSAQNIIYYFLEFLFHVKALKDLLFLSNQVLLLQYFSCYVFLLSSINLTLKLNLLKPFTGKYCLIQLEIVKRPNKRIYDVEIMLPPTQHYLVYIRFQRKISSVMYFTISKG